MLWFKRKSSIQSFKVPASESQAIKEAAEKARARLTPGQHKMLNDARRNRYK